MVGACPSVASAQFCPSGWDFASFGCEAGLSDIGCCSADDQVKACHNATTCTKTCGAGASTGGEPCCEVHDTPGCCDQAIADCVCQTDLFCCVAGGSWDIGCVNAAKQCGSCDTCGGEGGGDALLCGWVSTKYDCTDNTGADPSGMYPSFCGSSDGAGTTDGSDDGGGADTGTTTGGCDPDCTADDGSPKECGDDGCGGECGKCPAEGWSCVEGVCEKDEEACTPNCLGKECGPDGCNGSCGVCQAPAVCDPDTQTCETEVKPPCEPECEGKECGPDGCGGVCGECTDENTGCIQGQCVDANTDASGVDGEAGSDFAGGNTAGRTGTDAGGTAGDTDGADGEGDSGEEECGPGYVKVYGNCILKENLQGDDGSGGGGGKDGCVASPGAAPVVPLMMLMLLWGLSRAFGSGFWRSSGAAGCSSLRRSGRSWRRGSTSRPGTRG